MTHKSLDKQIDDIFTTLYEAADVPPILRSYLGRQFTVALERQVDQTLLDYMQSAYDPTQDIRGLQTRVKELQDAMNQLQQALDKIRYELR